MEYHVSLMYNSVIYNYIISAKNELDLIIRLPILLGNKSMYNILTVKEL